MRKIRRLDNYWDWNQSGSQLRELWTLWVPTS